MPPSKVFFPTRYPLHLEKNLVTWKSEIAGEIKKSEKSEKWIKEKMLPRKNLQRTRDTKSKIWKGKKPRTLELML